MLLWTILVAIVGLCADLLLLGHYETVIQCLPLGMMALAMAATTWYATQQSAASGRTFLGIMAAFALVGLAGLIFHYRGNMEFELEMHPTMTGFSLFWETIRGATPALAPASMTYVGLAGIAYYYLTQSRTS